AEIEAVTAPPARKGLLLASIGAAVLIAGGAIWYAVTHKGETKVIKDLEAQQKAERELAAERARRTAERARQAVKDKGLAGLALADALEAMAREHPDSDAARAALEESKRVRAEVAATEQQKAARAQRLNQALAALEKTSKEARAGGDFAAAAKALE